MKYYGVLSYQDIESVQLAFGNDEGEVWKLFQDMSVEELQEKHREGESNSPDDLALYDRILKGDREAITQYLEYGREDSRMTFEIGPVIPGKMNLVYR